MQNITHTAGLKNAIQLLEIEQAIKKQLLNEQFHITYESLKPINILKSTLKDVISSENILGTTVGLASGYLSKKIVVGASGNIFRKLIGSVLQFGVSSVIANHPDAIKSFGNFILQYIPRKKKIISREP